MYICVYNLLALLVVGVEYLPLPGRRSKERGCGIISGLIQSGMAESREKGYDLWLSEEMRVDVEERRGETSIFLGVYFSFFFSSSFDGK